MDPLDDELVRILDLDGDDRREIETLLSTRPVDTDRALAGLRGRLGAFPGELIDGRLDERAWICAIVEFVPDLLDWYIDHDVPPGIREATLADVGRQFRLHRRTRGAFGLETWGWLTLHLAGNLFHLGRLQFALKPGTGGWELDVHIPPTGPLGPTATADAYRWSVRFFAERFPEHPVTQFTCFSWLLDPYLSEHLPHSNIARFQDGFRRLGAGTPCTDDVLYFVFRTRDGVTDDLPRDTSLQRAVLDRIDAGEPWLAFRGSRPLTVGAIPDGG